MQTVKSYASGITNILQAGGVNLTEDLYKLSTLI